MTGSVDFRKWTGRLFVIFSDEDLDVFGDELAFGESGVFGEEIAGGDGGVGFEDDFLVGGFHAGGDDELRFAAVSAEEGADAGDTAEALPSGDAHETDDAEEGTQGEAGAEFAAEDAPPVGEFEFLEGEGADDEGGALGAGVSAGGDDEGNEERDDGGFFDFAFEVSHGGGGEHFAEEEDGEPAAALFHHLPEADGEVRRIEGFLAAHLLDVFGGFELGDVEDVVGGDDAEHVALIIGDGEGDAVIFFEEFDHDFAVGGGLDGNDLALIDVTDEDVGIGHDESAEAYF